MNVTDLADLGYNESGIGKVFWVIAVPREKKRNFRTIQDFEGKKIYTELPNTVRRFFADHGVHVILERSVGTTESKAPFFCDAIVDLCETGKSLLTNGLVPLYSMLSSTVHLYACNETMGYGWKRRKIEKIVKMLKAGTKKLPKNPKRFLNLPSI